MATANHLDLEPGIIIPSHDKIEDVLVLFINISLTLEKATAK